MPFLQPSQTDAPPLAELSTKASTPFNAMDAIRVLRNAGKTLFSQAGLHGELLRVEWAAEKLRLRKMATIALFAFACLLSALIFAGAIAIAFAWDTPYRIVVALGVLAAYTAATLIAWQKFNDLSALGPHAFAASRAELAADLDLLRSKL